MNKSLIVRPLVLLLSAFFVSFFFVSDVRAACSGSLSCSIYLGMVNTPAGCTEDCAGIPAPACIQCTGQQASCGGSQSFGCSEDSDGQCTIYVPTSCCGSSVSGSCTASSTPPPSGCPSGYVYCGGCISACRPNTSSCSAHINAECSATSTPPPASWGACGSCSSCPPFGGSSQCVTSPEGACLWDPGTCGGGGGACSMEWQGGPSTMYLGQRMVYTVFSRGALSDWTIHFRWTNKNNTGPAVGYFDQQTSYPFWYGECIPGATCAMGVTATTVGSGIVYAYTEDGDWRTDDLLCATTRPLTVLACTPSCVANCGQPNGCGANCASTDSGAPATPTNLSPADGTNVAPNTSQVTISWSSASALTDTYDLEVAPASNLNCAAAGGVCASDLSATSYNFNISNGIYLYAYRVRATNLTCSTQDGAWSPWTYFGIADSVTGTFYSDPNNTSTVAGGVCVPGSGSTATYLGTGASLTGIGIDGVTRTAVITADNFDLFTYFWNPGNNTLTLDPGLAPNGEPYICTCPNGCTYSGINSPQTNVHFFIREDNLNNQGWWQTRGSNAYAAESSGVALRSYIPDYYCTSANGCIPYVLASDLANRTDSAGLALTGGGAVDTSKDAGNSATNTNERSSQVTAIGTQNTKLRENYDFYYREFSLGLNPSDDFSSSANDARKPSSAPANGKQAYFHSGDLTIQNAWNVAAGEKMTIIVDGNLTISDPSGLGQLIQVQTGGFLAFIVSGNITVNANVGNSTLTNTTPNIEGVYIADGQLLFPSVGAASGGDERFVGAGTFVGWSGITMSRDYDDGGTRKAENNTKPTETFIFRPDFVLNVPEQMTRSNYIWQETN